MCWHVFESLAHSKYVHRQLNSNIWNNYYLYPSVLFSINSILYLDIVFKMIKLTPKMFFLNVFVFSSAIIFQDYFHLVAIVLFILEHLGLYYASVSQNLLKWCKTPISLPKSIKLLLVEENSKQQNFIMMSLTHPLSTVGKSGTFKKK